MQRELEKIKLSQVVRNSVNKLDIKKADTRKKDLKQELNATVKQIKL